MINIKDRENLLSLYKRKGYTKVPLSFELCPSLEKKFREITGEDNYEAYFGFSHEYVRRPSFKELNFESFSKFHNDTEGKDILYDCWGVGYEKGSENAVHMRRMKHPLKKATTLNEIKEYPFPDFRNANYDFLATQVEGIHNRDKVSMALLGQTIWETSWKIRSMEELMMDMMEGDDKADYILDIVTNNAIIQAEKYAKSGIDVIHLGDDIGMQKSIMMSHDLYCEYIKPRLQKVIKSIKKIDSNILVFYHTCGYVEPFIPDLIESGIDILNPVQPECMNFEKIHAKFGDVISFNGTIGTQTTMPFGTVDEIKKEVYKNLKIAGSKGGLLCCPTHMLEPEVPWENIIAYVEACRSF